LYSGHLYREDFPLSKLTKVKKVKIYKQAIEDGVSIEGLPIEPFCFVKDGLDEFKRHWECCTRGAFKNSDHSIKLPELRS
jgi:hypothetical protein